MRQKNILKTKRLIIGMIHFSQLLGYPNYKNVGKILEDATYDLKVLEKGGVDAVMVENNYDIPHKIFVDPESIVSMTYLTGEIVKSTKLPVGISVLWNDYKTSLSIAKICGGKFVRIPVFVDNVKTNYGEVYGMAKEIQEYRKKIKAEEIKLLTDIHVKHAVLLSSYSLEESAKKATVNGSDAVIITGKWTGDAPNIEDLKKVRKGVGNFPILIGSGAAVENIRKLSPFINGVIISTSLKRGKKKVGEINIKKSHQRLDPNKVSNFVKEYKRNN